MYNDMPPKFYKKKNGYQRSKPNSRDFQKGSAIYLVIVESPSKCAKIEDYLGSQYKCIASNGHIRQIMGLKSIDTKNTFNAEFSIIDLKNAHINKMKSIISQFEKENIILASDDDREGEAIAWHICQVFGLDVKTTKRIIFHEITEPAIREAIENPTTVNMNIVLAQQARQVLDVIVGYKISPYLWKYINSNGNGKDTALSAGRCQTPALRLVYDNHLEGLAAKNVMKYKTTASFFSKQLIFDLHKEFDTSGQVLSFLEESKQFKHILSIGEQKQAVKAAPKPFHTARLLQVASNVLHLSPKQTMDICQKLYQGGHITYMRTESRKYSKPFLEKASKYILAEFKDTKMVGDLNQLENKNTNNPHEAIRVTNIQHKFVDTDDNRTSSLYRLIWKNTVESCMADAIYQTHSIRITAPEESWYSHVLEIPIFHGWKTLDKKQGSNETETDILNGLLFYIQTIENRKKPVDFNNIESKVVVRNKHSFYTESTLINQLEDLGIGRPSTFASIVDTIQDRGYVKKQDIPGSLLTCKDFRMNDQKAIMETTTEREFGKEKNKLVIQSVGLSTIQFLLEYYEPMFSYEYTNKMEMDLDELSNKLEPENERTVICKKCYNEIKELSKPVNQVAKQVYKIDDTHEFMYNKFGPVVRKKMENTETDGKYEFLPIKNGLTINIDKLKNGEYVLEDLVEYTTPRLGEYDGHDLFIRTGKFGNYVEWGENKQSIKEIRKRIGDITIDDIIEFMNKKNTETDTGGGGGEQKTGILRVLNDTMNIRTGKFGPYVFYKRPEMKKPMFLNIKKFKEGFFICEIDTLVKWLCKTYNLPE